MKDIDYTELNALAFIYSCTIGQVYLLAYYIKMKSCPYVRLSVRPSVSPYASWENLTGFFMNRLGTWFLHSQGLQDVHGCVS